MDYYIKNGDIFLRKQDLSLSETLDCGQAFRWESLDGGRSYHGFMLDKPLTVSEDDESIVFHNVTEDDFLNIWADYFDLSTDYGELKRRFSEDATLKIACEFAGGIRLLRQDKWEALCSFIISQNNNIPRIKGIISRLCESFGDKTGAGFTFPPAKRLAELECCDLSPLRAGFRARYIIDAAKKINSGEIKLEDAAILPLDEARKELMKICGVGVKVADCAMLYGMHRLEFFPVDVWIRRVLERYYPNGLPECIKGFEGIAQQYLFHYVRNTDGF
ncbi:MAG: DNA glycosylase [Oscillospiraceae bacterium]|jgi:N-glycosylase/DNA lyase